MDATSFDFIVIGAGSGNSIPGPEFEGQRIALIDAGEHFGGTCLNVGCLPTKMFVHVADVLTELREAVERLGVSSDGASADWAAVRDRTFGRIDAISDSGERYRRDAEQITLIRERVRFIDTHTLITEHGETLTAPRIVIAAGSRPRLLPELPLGPRVHTSDTIMRLETFPEHLVIVGGGAIASEFAHVFSALGARVTQIQRSTLLKGVDAEVAEAFTVAAKQRWDVRLGVTITGAEITERELSLQLSDGSVLACDTVLVATGRIPNTDSIDAGKAGFDLHADGRLVVDETLRVQSGGAPVEGIFALGDICSHWQLKHVANEQQRVVHHNLAAASEQDYRRDTLGPVPGVVFTAPQVSWFGLTLEAALAAGHDAFEIRQNYGDTGWGWALEDTTSFVKLVVDRADGTLLGAHLIGPDSAVLMQILIMAASLGHSVRGLARAQYWPHPAASEIIENALLKAEEHLGTSND